MSPVQIERLRPQINALAAQFESSEAFIASLDRLFESYREEIELSPNSFTAFALIPSLNIPEVVLNQLEIIINHKTPIFPEQSKEIAEAFWEKDFLEYKQTAIIMAIRIFSVDPGWFFEKSSQWIIEDTPQPVIDFLLSSISENSRILNHAGWGSIIEKWINSDSVRLQKVGLKALTEKAVQKDFQNLPGIFKIVESIFSNPTLALSNELQNFINKLIGKSEPEISAFLIHMHIMHPSPALAKFIRKCLPFFSTEFQVEIEKQLL
jgi:hypothetical protein